MSGLRLVAQSEHAVRLREAGDRKLAQLDPAAAACAGKGGGCDDGALETAGQLLQTRGEIDGGSDAGEVEAATAADIAEQDAPDMQRDAEAEPLDRLSARVMHRIDVAARLVCRLQNASANLGEIAAVL